MPVGSLALACKFQTAERWGGEGERFSPESPQLAGTALPAPGEPGGCQRQGGLALSTGHPAPKDGGGQRTGRRLAASAGTAFNSFLERSQSFRPVACHGRLEGERGDRVQGAGAGGALTGVALRPRRAHASPRRRQNCSLKVRSLRCPLWPAPTLEGTALKSESVCGTQASPGECGSCWGLRLETGGPVLPSDGPRRV